MAITGNFAVGVQVDTTSFPIQKSSTNLYPFAAPVPLSAVAPLSTLSITFANPAPNPGGGFILINTDTFAATPFVAIPAGATSLTLPNASPNTTWFGVGLTGTGYGYAQIANDGTSATPWTPGLVTFIWH